MLYRTDFLPLTTIKTDRSNAFAIAKVLIGENQNDKSSKFESFISQQYPFSTTPSRPSKNIVWAGIPRLKQRFNEIFEEATFSSATQVVLNPRPWGGGKTHASFYFWSEDNLPQCLRSERESIQSHKLSKGSRKSRPGFLYRFS